MGQYKYYFRKPKSEIVKDVLNWLAISGAVCIAAGSPYFVQNFLKNFKNKNKYQNKKIHDTFYQLRKNGCIQIDRKNHQISISLTEKGKKKAGRFQIDSLKIKKPQKWDGKWRIVIFDIAQIENLKRNAFRGKLEELGFKCVQKSVWVYPYQCEDEIKLLRDFFGLNKKDIRLITAESIEDDISLRKIFNL
ncbi:MAG: hypothetical protein V1739_07085 [Candidatus Omnitrophota bacterium]